MKQLRDAPLSGYTSLHVGGPAASLWILEPGETIQEAAAHAAGPVWVLGYGTNALISDKGLDGTVIINQVGKIEVLDGKITADSGAVWDELVAAAIDNSLWGLEFTSGIPGGVGAAVAGNIAAYGHKIADSFLNAAVLDTKTGQISTWDNSRFEFEYRSSAIQRPQNQSSVILSAVFELSAQPAGELEYESALKASRDLDIAPDSLANRRKIIMEARRRAGSLLTDVSVGPWTAGSFFKNPLIDESKIDNVLAHEEVPGKTKEQILKQNKVHGQDEFRVSAALVLLAAGFKRGQTWGQVQLNQDNLLKIENAGSATAGEIYAVVQEIITTVKAKLDIELQPEVRYLGDF